MVKAHMNDTDAFVNSYGVVMAMGGAQTSPWMLLAGACARANLWPAVERYLEAGRSQDARIGDPLLAAGDLALEFKQPDRAVAYVERAAQGSSGAPDPWLRLCDLAIASGNMPTARRYLAEAEKRGAPAEAVAKRREQVGGEDSGTIGAIDSIIR